MIGAGAGSYTGMRLSFLMTAALLSVAMVLGGGQGTLGDTLAQLLSIALLGWMVVRAGWNESEPLPLWTWWPVLAIVVVPILQNLPIPESIWRSLDGRVELAQQLTIADVAPQPRWGLNPFGSERALFWLLPAIAMYLSVLRLSQYAQRHLVTILLSLVALSVLLGLMQLAGGVDTALRFYANTNRSSAVGFFANRNHFAGLLALSLPLAMSWTHVAIERSDDRGMRALRIALGVGLCLLLILGLAIARSRAGIVLGTIAIALTLPLLLTTQRRRSRRVAMAALLIGLLAAPFALSGVLQRLGQDPLDDGRWVYVSITARAAQTYGPLGSGLGTFRQAVEPFEHGSPDGSGRAVVNHAHNDYLEAWLETGWLMPVVALVLIGTLVFAALHAGRYRDSRSNGDFLHRRSVIVAALIPVLYSVVDYPMRTTAYLAVFGLLAGLLVAAALSGRRLVGTGERPKSDAAYQN